MKWLAVFILSAALALAQAPEPKSVTVCWQGNAGQPDATAQTCQVLNPGTVVMMTFDLRSQPLQYVVTLPLPDYMIQALQTHVSNQTYNQQQADGTLKTIQRYTSIQDLLVQYLLRSITVPVLQLYPPTGVNTGKTSFAAVASDVRAATTIVPVQ